jgi:hypothetical protein
LKKSGIVSLTRSNPFAFSYAIGGEVAAAVLQRNAIATMVKVVRVIATLHIISSLLRGEQKRLNSPREILGNHRRQSEQSRLVKLSFFAKTRRPKRLW